MITNEMAVLSDEQKLDLVDEAYRLHDKKAAARMWVKLGLEMVPAMRVPFDIEGEMHHIQLT